MFFRNEYAFLSNMYPSPITVNGITYTCVEAAFQSFKTANREERLRFSGIDGVAARKLGRKITLRSDWEDIKVEVMVRLLRKKFSKPSLRKMLLATGNQPLEEYNMWNDTFWGKDVRTWKGQNVLGELLMKIRKEFFLSEVRNECH